MKLLVDATPLIRRQADGISRYSQNLLANLKGYDFELIGFFDDPKPSSQILENLRITKGGGWLRHLPLPRRFYSLLYKLFVVPAIGSADDVMLCLNFVEFPKTNAKTIVVVHDLAYLHQPKTVQPRNRWHLKRFVPWSIKRAAKVVAISQTTAANLAKAYKLDQTAIAIIPPGVDGERFKRQPGDAIDRVRREYDLPQNYILFVGTLEPRKNINGCIEAYTKLPEAVRRRHPLVLAGAHGWLNREFKHRMEHLLVRGYRIVTPGFIETGDLPAVYSGAAAFVMPSFEEGFGIPVIEAMACGAPVVASDIPVLREVAGPAALFADPERPDDIAAKLAGLLTDDALASDLSRRGLARAKGYSWQTSADQLAAIIKQLSA